MASHCHNSSLTFSSRCISLSDTHLFDITKPSYTHVNQLACLGFRKALGSLNSGKADVTGYSWRFCTRKVPLISKDNPLLCSSKAALRCTVRLTPPCVTSWFACSLYMLIITWSISTSLISRGTVVFGVVLKSSSDTVTCHLFVITFFHCNTK